MRRWPLMLLFAANALAAQQPPDARADSARVARVLALLETSDSTVCELGAQAISNAWGWSWQLQPFATPMPIPMPAPMPMPRMRPGARCARARAPQPRRGLARDGLRRLRRVPRRAA